MSDLTPESALNKYFDSCQSYFSEVHAKLVQHQRAFYAKEQDRITEQLSREYKIKLEEERCKITEYYENYQKLTEEAFHKKIKLLEEVKMQAEGKMNEFKLELNKKSKEFNQLKLENESIITDMQKKSKEIEEIKLELQRRTQENERVIKELEKTTKENDTLKLEFKKKIEIESRLNLENVELKSEVQKKTKENEVVKLELHKKKEECTQLEKDKENLQYKNARLKETVDDVLRVTSTLRDIQSPAPNKNNQFISQPSLQIPSLNDSKIINKKRTREEPRTPLSNLTNNIRKDNNKPTITSNYNVKPVITHPLLPYSPFVSSTNNRTRFRQ